MISQVNLLTNLVNETSSLRDQLAKVQDQVASGYLSTTYSGLGDQALTAVSLSPQIAAQTTYQSNISAAQTRLQLTQGALTAISGVASNFYAQINTFNAGNPQSIQDLAQSATAALQEVADQLNTQDGSVYVFAGTDTSNAPVTTDDPATLATDLLAVPTTQAPFSTTIGTSAPKVQIGENQWQSIGLLANQNTYAVSQSPTSGSYMRDILTSLAQLSQLGSAPSPSATVANVRNVLSSAITAIGTEAGVLGGVQDKLTQQQTDLSTLSTTLSTQLGSAQDVDVASAISQSTQLQTQLQASYQIIANSSKLSLAQYL